LYTSEQYDPGWDTRNWVVEALTEAVAAGYMVWAHPGDEEVAEWTAEDPEHWRWFEINLIHNNPDYQLLQK
jgi:hypothetical protein